MADADMKGSFPAEPLESKLVRMNEYIPVAFSICEWNIASIRSRFVASCSPPSTSNSTTLPSSLSALTFIALVADGSSNTNETDTGMRRVGRLVSSSFSKEALRFRRSLAPTYSPGTSRQMILDPSQTSPRNPLISPPSFGLKVKPSPLRSTVAGLSNFTVTSIFFAGAASELRPYSAAASPELRRRAKRGWTRPGSDGRPADKVGDSENGRGISPDSQPADAEEKYVTVFGLRDIEYREDGIYIDGVKTFLKGVCLHHDAGALGAVWNNTAWERRLKMLKEMGCNAIRTSHNPPAPELLDLCDRMGFVVMDELTDTWTVPKKPNGYALLFNDWADKDLVAMIHRDRNHPSVILWSIGNETGEQGYPDLYHIPAHLTEICHTEDPTRLTTFGSDNPWASEQEFRNTMDIYGFNYKPHLYSKFHEANPGKLYLGSETASTISTRGVYFFPIEEDPRGKEFSEKDFQVSSYDLHTVPWGQIPEQEWELEDANPTCLGEFVWTGFDYLGEPTPYNRDLTILTNFHDPETKAKAEKEIAEKGVVSTPSRSSYFGIIDLAGFPKDRYWLYQARWSDKTVLHVLPHWNWEGREGEVTPVHVYTNCDKVELFVNGESKGTLDRADKQYRLRWDDVIYQPGKIEAIGWKDGKKVASETVKTAGPASKIKMSLEKGFGEGDIYYIDVKLTDKKGIFAPRACDELTFSVKGPGEILAVDAGDPTCLTPFHSDKIKAFNGLASVIIKTKPGSKGKIVVTATSEGLRKGKIRIKV